MLTELHPRPARLFTELVSSCIPGELVLQRPVAAVKISGSSTVGSCILQLTECITRELGLEDACRDATGSDGDGAVLAMAPATAK